MYYHNLTPHEICIAPTGNIHDAETFILLPSFGVASVQLVHFDAGMLNGVRARRKFGRIILPGILPESGRMIVSFECLTTAIAERHSLLSRLCSPDDDSAIRVKDQVIAYTRLIIA